MQLFDDRKLIDKGEATMPVGHGGASQVPALSWDSPKAAFSSITAQSLHSTTPFVLTLPGKATRTPKVEKLEKIRFRDKDSFKTTQIGFSTIQLATRPHYFSPHQAKASDQ